jgi:hypothetical protein
VKQRGTLKPSETNYLEPYCADCMTKIQSRGVGTVFAYFDSRLRAWVCPDCMQERRRLEAIREAREEAERC